MDLGVIRRVAFCCCQDWRSIDRTLNLQEFDIAWDAASDDDRQHLELLVMAGDRYGVNKWLTDQKAIKVGGRSLRELRALARHACIQNYSSMSKDELISALGGAA